MVRWKDFKYIKSVGENSQLYDLAKDPEELNNLAFDPEYKNIAEKLDADVSEGWELPPKDYKCRPKF
jgi:choline-sulfatase